MENIPMENISWLFSNIFNVLGSNYGQLNLTPVVFEPPTSPFTDQRHMVNWHSLQIIFIYTTPKEREVQVLTQKKIK